MMPVIELARTSAGAAISASPRTAGFRPSGLARCTHQSLEFGYVDCFEYLRRCSRCLQLLSSKRLSIVMIYANAILSAHEAALEKAPCEGQSGFGVNRSPS